MLKYDIIYFLFMLNYLWWKYMHVKIFDEESEKDLEFDINEFLNEEKYDIIDIKYTVSASMFGEDQIYCFSALVWYNEK